MTRQDVSLPSIVGFQQTGSNKSRVNHRKKWLRIDICPVHSSLLLLLLLLGRFYSRKERLGSASASARTSTVLPLPRAQRRRVRDQRQPELRGSPRDFPLPDGSETTLSRHFHINHRAAAVPRRQAGRQAVSEDLAAPPTCIPTYINKPTVVRTHTLFFIRKQRLEK